MRCADLGRRGIGRRCNASSIANWIAGQCAVWGHEMKLALDAEAALRIIPAFRPDFALIDLELPGLSGNELARCLRANAAYADMTLLAITGYGRPRDRREAMKAGFDEYLLKPVDIDILQAKLDKNYGSVARHKTGRSKQIHQ